MIPPQVKLRLKRLDYEVLYALLTPVVDNLQAYADLHASGAYGAYAIHQLLWQAWRRVRVRFEARKSQASLALPLGEAQALHFLIKGHRAPDPLTEAVFNQVFMALDQALASA